MRMRVVEVSGRTVEEAVARALEQLGLRREQVDVDVILEGRRGVFGIGSEDAIVRVTAKEPLAGADVAPARAPRHDPDRPPRHDDDDEGQTRPPAARPGGAGRGPRGVGTDRSGGGGGHGGYGGQRDSGGGGYGGGGRFAGRAAPPRGRLISAAEAIVVPGAPVEPPLAPPAEAEDQTDFAGRTLRDILNLLGLPATEIAARDPETAGDGLGLATQVLDVYGNDEDTSEALGLLIGRRGETLASLQYLLNIVVSSRYGNDSIFGLDIDQYRRRREQSLIEMAKRIAAEVRETGDVITLEPMPAAERRIIHITLEQEPGVRTESVGTGPDRQVEVLPSEGEEA